MPNTEKPTPKVEQKRQGIVKAPKQKEMNNSPVQKKETVEKKPEAKKPESADKAKEDKETKREEKTGDKKTEGDKTEKKEDEKEKKDEEKSAKKKETKVKKTEAFVNVSSIPISTKHSIAVCKFIKGKRIEEAIKDLEEVILLKKAVPMKGEIPHRKGMMSGRYPKNTSEHFIKLLKSLSANASGLEDPVISEAIANLASRPYGKFGRVRKKRTHIKIVAKEKEKALVHSSEVGQSKEKEKALVHSSEVGQAKEKNIKETK